MTLTPLQPGTLLFLPVELRVQIFRGIITASTTTQTSPKGKPNLGPEEIQPTSPTRAR